MIFFSLFLSNTLLLGWIGGQPIEEPMYTVGQLASILYFIYILIGLPMLNNYLTKYFLKNI